MVRKLLDANFSPAHNKDNMEVTHRVSPLPPGEGTEVVAFWIASEFYSCVRCVRIGSLATGTILDPLNRGRWETVSESQKAADSTYANVKGAPCGISILCFFVLLAFAW